MVFAEDILALPFDVASLGVRDVPGDFDCPAYAGEVPHDLIFKGVYRRDDPHRAEVDIAAQAAYRKQAAPLVRFETDILRMSNDYLASGARSKKRAQCVLEHLYVWARGNALLGRINKAGVFVRSWSLASLAMAYAQIQDEISLDIDKKVIVAEWLRRVAFAVMVDYPLDSDVGRHNNNLLYWAAWAVAAASMAIQEKSFFDWAMHRAREVVSNDINPDGTLPLELRRGKRAFQYHNFAVTPLVMLAEAGLHNGIDLYALNGGILHELVLRVLEGFDDTSYFEEKTGIKQDAPETFNGSVLAWAEVYHARFPGELAEKWLARYRPMVLRRIGGNATFLWGKGDVFMEN